MSALRLTPDRGDVTALSLPPLDAIDAAPIEALPAVLIYLTAVQARIAARIATVSSTASPTPDAPADDWLTPQEAATYVNLPVSWVRDNARRGKLRSHKRGHYVRFRRSELDEDLRRLESTSEDA